MEIRDKRRKPCPENPAVECATLELALARRLAQRVRRLVRPHPRVCGQDVEQVWRDLLARADRGDVTDPDSGQPLSSLVIINAVLGELYGPNWVGIAGGIADLQAGRGATGLDFGVRYGVVRQQEQELVEYPFTVFCEEWSLPVKNHREFAGLVRQSMRIAPNDAYLVSRTLPPRGATCPGVEPPATVAATSEPIPGLAGPW